MTTVRPGLIDEGKGMQFSRWLMSASLAGLLALTGAVSAENTTKVELTGVHLCCGACVKAVAAVLKASGVEGQCNQQKKTVTITAPDVKAAQKALDALAKAGFYGKTDNKEVTIKDDSGVRKGKVDSLTLTGAHNCCGACCKAIKATVTKVDGVKGDTAEPKKDTFEVTGNFDAEQLIKALNAAGFHVKVKK
jgi:periplasmic mercuric ion binding protein